MSSKPSGYSQAFAAGTTPEKPPESGGFSQAPID